MIKTPPKSGRPRQADHCEFKAPLFCRLRFRTGKVTQRNPVFKKKKKKVGAGEMALWLRVLTALPEDPGSIPTTHMAVNSCR